MVVPEFAQAGDVYLITGQGLISNRVPFTVNDDPLGAGICQIIPSSGVADTPVVVKGDRFDEEADGQGEDNLVFTDNVFAPVSDWSNHNIAARVPEGAQDGSVVVTKRREVDRQCIGFSIGSVSYTHLRAHET